MRRRVEKTTLFFIDNIYILYYTNCININNTVSIVAN